MALIQVLSERNAVADPAIRIRVRLLGDLPPAAVRELADRLFFTLDRAVLEDRVTVTPAGRFAHFVEAQECIHGTAAAAQSCCYGWLLTVARPHMVEIQFHGRNR